jgi:hypothetical protein
MEEKGMETCECRSRNDDLEENLMGPDCKVCGTSINLGAHSIVQFIRSLFAFVRPLPKNPTELGC